MKHSFNEIKCILVTTFSADIRLMNCFLFISVHQIVEGLRIYILHEPPDGLGVFCWPLDKIWDCLRWRRRGKV